MKLLGPNWVKAETFEIKRVSKDELVYLEKNKEAKIFVEPIIEPSHGLAIYISILKKWNNGAEISSSELQSIEQNIRAAFEFLKIRIVIQ